MKFRCLFLSMSFLIAHSALAKNLEAIPLNPVVKDSTLKVRLNGVPDLKEVFFKPKNGGVEVEGEIQKLNNGVIIGKLKTSQLSPGTYEYRVRIRSISGNTDIQNSASVDFINFKIDPSLEVADPGEKGNGTLEGIDEDKNGIRDDIQRYINENYPQSSNVSSGIKQYAKAYQQVLITSKNKEQSIASTYNVLKATTCLIGLEGSVDVVDTKLKTIDRRIINTEERFLAQKRSGLHFSGQSGKVPKDKISSCEFVVK